MSELLITDKDGDTVELSASVVHGSLMLLHCAERKSGDECHVYIDRDAALRLRNHLDNWLKTR